MYRIYMYIHIYTYIYMCGYYKAYPGRTHYKNALASLRICCFHNLIMQLHARTILDFGIQFRVDVPAKSLRPHTTINNPTPKLEAKC